MTSSGSFAHVRLMIRPGCDALAFSIGSGASLRCCYTFERADGYCACWPEILSEPHHGELLKPGVWLTDEEALVTTTLRCAFGRLYHDFAVSDDHGLGFVQNYTLWKIRPGAQCTDITASGRNKGRIIGPPRALCLLHRSVEYYWISRNVLCYILLLGACRYVRVT